VDTRKLGLIFLVISGSMVVIAFMTFIVGGFNLEEIDVEEKSIYKGVDGDINVNKYDVYSVFVTSEYSCKDVELSIYKDDWEYFFEDCDALFNEDGWNYIGYFSPDFDGNIEIDSNQQILIINDDIYFDEGGFEILISLLFCCLGFFGIIISIIMVFSSSSKVTFRENIQEIVIINSDAPEVVIPDDGPTKRPEEIREEAENNKGNKESVSGNNWIGPDGTESGPGVPEDWYLTYDGPAPIVEDIYDENYVVDRGNGTVPVNFYIKKWGIPEGFGKTDHEKLWSME